MNIARKKKLTIAPL